MQCIYGCESNPTDACANACLDIYWPVIGSEEDLHIQLPFVKRDSDPTVMPSGHHREEDGEDRGYGEKDRGGEFHDDGGHNSHNGGKKDGEGPFEFPPEKGKEENNHFDDVYDNFKDGPKVEFYPKDDFGPREGYRNRSMAVTSEIFTKTTISIIALAIAGACMIAF